MKKTMNALLTLVVSLMMIITIVGCGGGDSGGNADSGDASTNLGLTVTAVKKTKLASTVFHKFYPQFWQFKLPSG